jgi:pimeloyl-ACP methyl ester carboxylesterase
MAMVLVLAVSGFLPADGPPTGPSQGLARERTDPTRPALPPGGGIVSLTCKSPVDGSPQLLLAKIPSQYTPQRKWPLLVTLHGAGEGPLLATEIDAMVQIGPSGRGSIQFSGIGARDVFDSIEFAERLFSIDPDRLCLCGFSMGADAVFQLAFQHPDLWAACVPVCGSSRDLDMVANARHVPFWIHTGGRDTTASAHQAKTVFQTARELGFCAWKYTEHPEMEHDFDINWPEVEQWLLTKRRVTHPGDVRLQVRGLHTDRAYWVQILGIQNYGWPASIQTSIHGQTIAVETTNVLNYALRWNPVLLDMTQEVHVVEAGDEVFRGVPVADRCFYRYGPVDGLRKRPGLSGPLWDVYSSTCVLVPGATSDNPLVAESARRCAWSFTHPPWMDRVAFRIVADQDVSDAALRGANVVLFGNAASNAVLARIEDRLPLHMAGTRISAGPRTWSVPQGGYVLVYPNPLNPEHYVAVFAGNTPEAIDCFEALWPTPLSVPRDIDFGVFQLPPAGGSVSWLATGVFDTNWQWPPRPSQTE